MRFFVTLLTLVSGDSPVEVSHAHQMWDIFSSSSDALSLAFVYEGSDVVPDSSNLMIDNIAHQNVTKWGRDPGLVGMLSFYNVNLPAVFLSIAGGRTVVAKHGFLGLDAWLSCNLGTSVDSAGNTEIVAADDTSGCLNSARWVSGPLVRTPAEWTLVNIVNRSVTFSHSAVLVLICDDHMVDECFQTLESAVRGRQHAVVGLLGTTSMPDLMKHFHVSSRDAPVVRLVEPGRNTWNYIDPVSVMR